MQNDPVSRAADHFIYLIVHPTEEGIRELVHMLQQETTERLGLTRTPVLLRIGKEAGKRWGKKPLLRAHASSLVWLWEKASERPQEGPMGLRSGREIRLILVGMLTTKIKQEKEDLWAFFPNILKTLGDWETCDQLALRVVAPLVGHTPETGWAKLKSWIQSPDVWIRRLAVATLPAYIRAHPEETISCLELLRPVMGDPARVVQKAVGWALREMSKKDPDRVFSYLLPFAASPDPATRSILREGIKKLSPAQQQQILSKIKR